MNGLISLHRQPRDTFQRGEMFLGDRPGDNTDAFQHRIYIHPLLFESGRMSGEISARRGDNYPNVTSLFVSEHSLINHITAQLQAPPQPNRNSAGRLNHSEASSALKRIGHERWLRDWRRIRNGNRGWGRHRWRNWRDDRAAAGRRGQAETHQLLGLTDVERRARELLP